MQEDVTETIGEVVTDNIWGAIKSFLDLGFTLGTGTHEVRIAVWTLLLVILSFVGARFFLKWISVLLTRKMEEQDKLKFISFFKFTVVINTYFSNDERLVIFSYLMIPDRYCCHFIPISAFC